MNMHQQGGVATGSIKLNAGIDVSKLHRDVCVGDTQERVPNDANGWNELTAMLLAAPVDLVVMEATGGYERGLVCADPLPSSARADLPSAQPNFTR